MPVTLGCYCAVRIKCSRERLLWLLRPIKQAPYAHIQALIPAPGKGLLQLQKSEENRNSRHLPHKY